jgi:hypothetical protein
MLSYMESISSAAEEVLTDSLSFKLPGSGQYIQERRSVTFHTEGSNAYSPSGGTRVIRFKLSSEGWLDPSTVRVFFDVRNLDVGTAATDTTPAVPKQLRPLNAPHAFFRRLIIKMRGVLLEDIFDYNRVHEMFNILQSSNSRSNDRGEGFGMDNVKDLNTVAKFPGIANFQTVCFKPLCGILMQNKYLPLAYCPLEFELELADGNEPVVSETLAEFTGANTSNLYRLENCMIKCDICTLDNALNNNYISHLLSGKSLNIVYNTFISNIQTILSEDSQINVSRSLSKLKSVFISLQRDIAAGPGPRRTYYNKSWNNFYSPMAVDTLTTNTTNREQFEIESLQLQVGAFLMPQFPIRSHAEAYYSLRKSLGAASNSMYSIDISGNDYRNDKFIVGVDCEKLLGLAFTGMNTKNSLMTVKLKTGSTNKANRIHILLYAEQILEINDTGCSVYD